MLPSHLKQQPMTTTRAEEIAAQGARIPGRGCGTAHALPVATGISPQVLRRDAASHGMLAAVLEHPG